MPYIVAVTFGFFDQAELDRCRKRRRQETVHRQARRQRLRLVTDNAPEIGLRGRERCLGGQRLRLAGRELRLRLRNVGPGYLADIETILGFSV
jgi:hypothetical protein